MTTANELPEKNDFIRIIIRDDLQSGKHESILTRFPPEPNGYLHIGHVKSICLNFGVAGEFDGACNLRFDDTNPTAEKQDYVDGIKEDVKWLGFDWAGDVRYASSYFDHCTLGRYNSSSKVMLMSIYKASMKSAPIVAHSPKWASHHRSVKRVWK